VFRLSSERGRVSEITRVVTCFDGKRAIAARQSFDRFPCDRGGTAPMASARHRRIRHGLFKAEAKAFNAGLRHVLTMGREHVECPGSTQARAPRDAPIG
jgi:hypothetical protein